MRRLFWKKQKQQGEEPSLADCQEGLIGLAPELQNLYSPTVTSKTHVRDVADFLAEDNILSPAQIETLRAEQQRGTVDLEKYLQKLGISKVDVLKAKARLYGFEYRSVTPEDVEKETFRKLELSYIRSNLMLPIAVKDGVLTLGTADPSNVFGVDDVRRHVTMPVDVVVCSEEEILAVCDRFDENKLNYVD
jgi:hypothetical protein